MSISSLAVAATERRPDIGNLGATPENLTDIADAVDTNRVEAKARSSGAVSSALTVIVS